MCKFVYILIIKIGRILEFKLWECYKIGGFLIFGNLKFLIVILMLWGFLLV